MTLNRKIVNVLINTCPMLNQFANNKNELSIDLSIMKNQLLHNCVFLISKTFFLHENRFNIGINNSLQMQHQYKVFILLVLNTYSHYNRVYNNSNETLYIDYVTMGT